jgi:S-adenosyl-L-methionine hydrolase (adenosine-forming)
MPIVTLTTDFGTSDGYVGAMKGVILSLAPVVTVVDITHELPPQDVAAGAFALAQAASYFPDGTIHVAVVDPGVGGDRRGIILGDGRHLFVGPDNGLLSLACPRPTLAHEITSELFRAEDPAPTFHGRDVFAVAAARLACGHFPEHAGPAVTPEGSLAVDGLEITPTRVRGQVVHIDRFGNLITNIPGGTVPPGAHVVVGDHLPTARVLAVSRTYSDVGVGHVVAYVGSSGALEIAVRDGSAAERLGVGVGTPVMAAPES